MHSEKLELQSIKTHKVATHKLLEELDYFLISDTLNPKTNQVCYTIVDPIETITRYIDLTERFLKRLLRGNEYILVGYYFDANHIRAIPIKNRRGLTIIEVWEQLHNNFKKVGIAL